MSQQSKRSFFNFKYYPLEKRRGNRLAFILFWSILTYLFLSIYIFGMGSIADKSMLPTLEPDGRYLINKLIYRIRAPKRLEVVALKKGRDEKDHYVKRVIGLPGETVQMLRGKTLINGQLVEANYGHVPLDENYGPVVVGKDNFFVLGDNLPVSEDSRSFGPIHRRNIEGRLEGIPSRPIISHQKD